MAQHFLFSPLCFPVTRTSSGVNTEEGIFSDRNYWLLEYECKNQSFIMKNAPPLNKINTAFKNNFQHKPTPPLLDQSSIQLWSCVMTSPWNAEWVIFSQGNWLSCYCLHNKKKCKENKPWAVPEGSLNSTLWPRGSTMHHLKLFFSVPWHTAKDGSLIIVTVFTMNQSQRCTDLLQVQQKTVPMDESRPLSPASCQLEYDTSEAGMLPHTHITALSC